MMIPVNSSSIRAVAYHGYELFVLFHTSDTPGTHFGVPETVFHDFMNATPKDTYYNENIRGKYKWIFEDFREDR